MVRPRSVSPRSRYMPYHTSALVVSAVASRVMRGREQVSAQSLRDQLEDIKARLSATKIPLSTRVHEASQSVQQTTVVARQALERTSVA